MGINHIFGGGMISKWRARSSSRTSAGIDCFAERSQGGHGRKSWCFKWRNHGVFLVKTIWVRVSVPNEFYIVLCFHFGEHLGGSVLTKISLHLEMLSHQLVKRHGLGSVFGSHCCLRWIPAHRNRYCSMFLEYSSEQGLALADIPNSWYDWKDIFFRWCLMVAAFLGHCKLLCSSNSIFKISLYCWMALSSGVLQSAFRLTMHVQEI